MIEGGGEDDVIPQELFGLHKSGHLKATSQQSHIVSRRGNVVQTSHLERMLNDKH